MLAGLLLLLLCPMVSDLAAEDAQPAPAPAEPEEMDPAVELIIAPADMEAGATDAATDSGALENPLMDAKISARAAIYTILWDRYRTVIAIGDSPGVARPAWIATYSVNGEAVQTLRGRLTIKAGDVVVAYRGQAYYDKEGVLHVNASNAFITGPMASDWSPDTFAISADGKVTSHDDQPAHGGNVGAVETILSSDDKPEEYRHVLNLTQAVVGGGS